MIDYGNLMRHVFSYEITQHPNDTLNDNSRQTINSNEKALDNLIKCPHNLPTSYEIMIGRKKRNSSGNYYETHLIKTLAKCTMACMANATKI
jgi:hypothetical protein